MIAFNWVRERGVWRMLLLPCDFGIMNQVQEVLGLPRWLSGKEPACQAGDTDSVPGEGNGNPLQYSCLENPTDRGAWQATVHGVTNSQTRLSD